jgi:hypothetical protein
MSEPKHAPPTPPDPFGRWLPSWAVVPAAAVAWWVAGFVPHIVRGLPGGLPIPLLPQEVTELATMAFVGGAAAGLTAWISRSRRGGALYALVGALLAAGLASGATAWWLKYDRGEVFATRTDILAGEIAVVGLATLVGAALGALAAVGPAVLRATALAVPVVFAGMLVPYAADAASAPTTPGAVATVTLVVALGVVLGLALGSGVSRNPLTLLSWLPALALVWVAQACQPALTIAGDAVRRGADYLRDNPLDPLVTAWDYVEAALVDPSAHWSLIWPVAIVVGIATAVPRLLRRNASEAARQEAWAGA